MFLAPMHLPGALTGFIQNDIFTVLAMGYISPATRVEYEQEEGERMTFSGLPFSSKEK